MPAYLYRCANQHQTTKLYRVRDYVEAVDCEQCDLVAQRVFTPPIMVKVAADVCYDSPVTGEHITSHAARNEDLKRHNCVPYDPEMKKDAHRRQQDRQEQFEAQVEETVCHEIAKLSSGQREKLINEVVNQGADVEVVRQ